MKRVLHLSVVSFLFSWIFFHGGFFMPQNGGARNSHVAAVEPVWTERMALDSPVTPKVKPKSISTNPLDQRQPHPLQLKDPKNVTTSVLYDPVTNSYSFQRKIGNLNYGPSTQLSVDEYLHYDLDQALRSYWRKRAGVGQADTGKRGFLSQIRIPGEAFEDIFGSSKVDIRPTGSIDLRFALKHTKTDNKNYPVRQRRKTRFDFDEDIQLSLKASIGDKIHYDMNFKTKQISLLDENKFKLNYEGKEDEIIKLIEFGNITMPLTSTLIEGSQNLFGGKVQAQFGKLMLTTVYSRKNGDKRTITLENGSEYTEYEFKADDYEEDKHFFLAQYFYDHYAEGVSTLPLVNSKITITRIEVWKTNIGAAVEQNRNIIAIADLGEAQPYNTSIHSTNQGVFPDSNANDFLQGIDYAQMRNINNVTTYLKTYRGGMTSGVDFEKVESARLLSSNEYTFNAKLGFISLNTKLNSDQVLAVAFQYTVTGDPNVYQVGQFSNEVVSPNCIIVKLLRGTSLNTQIPLWKLMMKNVYALGAYQVSDEDFRLNVLYKGEDDGVGKGYFTEVKEDMRGLSIIRILGLDRLNSQKDAYPDGVFDFIDEAATAGGTIQASSGKIFFPYPEPFGKDLRKLLADSPGAGDIYAFDSLYTMTKTLAQQYSNKNKFYLEGRYKSSYGADISLGAYNVSEGSVKVLAGGIVLTEGIDYTVDYTAGTVRIINENYLRSGTPINVSVESENSLGMSQTMFGLHADYTFNKDFILGATLLNLSERSETHKVNFGDEPINNTIWGVNTTYHKELPALTNWLNYLPNYSSKAVSDLNFDGEFAQFLPGYARSIGKKNAAALYIDDFEGAQTTMNLTTAGMWSLASTPQNQTRPGMFPEAA
ncbi:MAG: cell surface protein SprA, partial [Bacteroidales bacterium]|nr:cell surface protein SprA [Bacteroidales bacterium]